MVSPNRGAESPQTRPTLALPGLYIVAREAPGWTRGLAPSYRGEIKSLIFLSIPWTANLFTSLSSVWTAFGSTPEQSMVFTPKMSKLEPLRIAVGARPAEWQRWYRVRTASVHEDLDG